MHVFGGKLSGEFGPVSLSGSYVMAGKDWQGHLSKKPLLVAEKGSAIEVGAGVDFLGIDVDGNHYREMDAENENAAVVQASLGQLLSSMYSYLSHCPAAMLGTRLAKTNVRLLKSRPLSVTSICSIPV